MERDYRRAVARLPRGCIVRKVIRGREYFYLAYREKDRVRFEYRGRELEEGELGKYEEAKQLRARYRGLLADLRKQIQFLRRMLRDKRAV
jgi:hypothetical protein